MCIQEIITKYSITSKFLSTNNALEFTQKELYVDCASLDTTCQPLISVHPSIIVLERKHHHIIDITHKHLFEMGVPHYVWAHIVLTANFVFNHLSIVLTATMMSSYYS